MAEQTEHSTTRHQTLSGYFEHPEAVSIPDRQVINALLEKYPYAQMLHAFHARSYNEDDDKFNTYLAKAALYIPDRNVLYDIINKPESFATQLSEPADEVVTESAVANDTLTEPVNSYVTESGNTSQETVTMPQDHSGLSDSAESEYPAQDVMGEAAVTVKDVLRELPDENADDPYLNELSDTQEEEDARQSPEAPESDASESDSEGLTPGGNSPERSGDETEKLILGNIASSDFFRFEEKLDDQLTTSPESPASSNAAETKHIDKDIPHRASEVSKYDDDKMPYTFLWWLNKTRKEHSATYQPYVSFKLDTTEDIKKQPSADLNQQIIENIFHLQSPLEDIPQEEKPKTVEFTLKRKDEQIIERFIREEPQIRPPRPEKLDNENKARRSSEDSYDMVSETLAQVYIEQALFHKAIDTYKKLSLKFPEKSAYFADQIRKLETSN